MLIKNIMVATSILALTGCAGANADYANNSHNEETGEHYAFVMDEHGSYFSSGMSHQEQLELRREIKEDIRAELEDARQEIQEALEETRSELASLDIDLQLDGDGFDTELEHSILMTVHSALNEAFHSLEQAEIQLQGAEIDLGRQASDMARAAEEMARGAAQMAREADAMKREAAAMKREAEAMRREAAQLAREKVQLNNQVSEPGEPARSLAPQAPVAPAAPKEAVEAPRPLKKASATQDAATFAQTRTPPASSLQFSPDARSTYIH